MSRPKEIVQVCRRELSIVKAAAMSVVTEKSTIHPEERTRLNKIESIGIQLTLERCELALTEPAGYYYMSFRVRSNELDGLQNLEMLGK
jgi:hypothetical protein